MRQTGEALHSFGFWGAGGLAQKPTSQLSPSTKVFAARSARPEIFVDLGQAEPRAAAAPSGLTAQISKCDILLPGSSL